MIFIKIHTAKPLYACYKPAKCIKPDPNKTYVKILKTCLKPASVREIYPGKKNIIPDQLYALENGGFLQRLTKPEWAHFRRNWPKTWWRTTPKGRKVLKQAEISC